MIPSCLKVVISKFDLVVFASQRAYNLISGAPPAVEHEKSDKMTVIPLKEIAHGIFERDRLVRDIALRAKKEGSSESYNSPYVLDLSDISEDEGSKSSKTLITIKTAEGTQEISFDDEQDTDVDDQ